MSECKVIIHDKYFWHSNIAKDFIVYSSGFFRLIIDPSDKWGFKIICHGESKSLEQKSKPDDDKMIKAMLLDVKVWEL
jgi:hypothetical protein